MNLPSFGLSTILLVVSTLRVSAVSATNVRSTTTQSLADAIDGPIKSAFGNDSISWSNTTILTKSPDPNKMCNDSDYLFESPPLPRQLAAKGDMKLISYTCDFPPQRSKPGPDYIYYFPVGSRMEIQCTSFSNSTCRENSHYILRHAQSALVTSTTMLDNWNTVFMVEVVEKTPPNVPIWVVCSCNGTDNEDHYAGPLKMAYFGHKPEPVVDFQCTVTDYLIATCTWDSQSDKNVTWNVCIGLSNAWIREEMEDGGGEISGTYGAPLCHWDTLVTNNLTTSFIISETDTYSVTSDLDIVVQGSNQYGNSPIFTFVYKVSFIKHKYNACEDEEWPDANGCVDLSTAGLLSAPEVNLLSVNSSTIIYLQWKQHCTKNVNYRFTCMKKSLNYTILLSVDEEITPDYENIYKAKRQITVNGSVNFESDDQVDNEIINITIDQLMPKTNYILSMRQMMKDNIRWSEPTVLRFQTEEDVPYRGPYFNKNSFMIHKGSCKTRDNKHGRIATIYWKGLGIHNGGNGIVTEYKHGEKKYPPETRELLTECISNTDTTISMLAATKKGRGTNSSLIVIPDTGNLMNLPTCLVRVRQTLHEPNKVDVNWRLLVEYLQPQNVTDFTYTIFWCRLVDQQCQEEFDWIEMDSNHGKTESTLELALNVTKYKFGVSVNNKSMSSGVLWSDCLLGHSPPHRHDVQLLVNQQGSSSAKVEVMPKCEDGMRMIESINLTYCEDGRRQDCPTLMSTIGHCPKGSIVELKHGATYTFSLNLNYSDTPGITPGPVVEGFSLKEDTRIIIIICVVTILAILIAVVIAIACYYIHRKRKLSKGLRATIIKPSPEIIEPDTESIDSESDDDKLGHCIGYRIVGGVPFITQSDSNEHPSTLEPTLEDEQTNERARLVNEIPTDTDVNGNQSQGEVTSDYGTGTDNSGTSLGYTKVTALLSEATPALDDYIRAKDLDEQMASSSGCLDDNLDGLDISMSGSSFKGITLEDVMFPKSNGNASNETKTPTDVAEEYLSIAQVLPTSASMESVPSPLNSGYIQVGRIVDKGSESSLADDYLRVHQTDKEDTQLEQGADTSDAYRNMKIMHLATPEDVNSSGTLGSFQCDMDDLESGHSAIDMTQFL